MKDFLVYTVARLGLFVASYAVVVGVYLLVTGGDSLPVLWPLLVAALVSALASAYLLKGPRARLAARVQTRAERMSERFEAMRAKEDED